MGTRRSTPEGTSGPRFTLASHGTGASQNQGFAFHATAVPAAGDYAIGELGAGTVRATYWYDEGSTRSIFQAESGTLRVEQSTATWYFSVHEVVVDSDCRTV